MRVKLLKAELNKIFSAIEQRGFGNEELAKALGVSSRHLRDWKIGKILLSKEAYSKSLALSRLDPIGFKPLILENYWQTKTAGKIGAQARMRLYGNIGTPEGRKKGGLASVKIQKNLGNTGFKLLKEIMEPDFSEDLAELLGILMGDGHLSHYQVLMTTNSVTDKQHANFVKSLFYKIFKLSASISFKKNQNAMNVIVSSKGLVHFINRIGMPIGNKIQNNLQIPAWVLDREIYQKAFLRGLFDTDGCVYLDKHIIRGKLYKHLGWTITSYAGKLREGIIEILKTLGFSPTYRVSQKSVFLRRQKEVSKYFFEIGSHNNKHLERYKKFSGEVPKWS